MDTLWRLMEKRAELDHNRLFLRFENEEYTYADLKRRVMAAASALRAKGLKPGDRALLMMASHPDHVVLYLALAWIGCVSVELSTHLKPAGIGLQIEDCDPQVMLIDAPFAADVHRALQCGPYTSPRVFVSGGSNASFDTLAATPVEGFSQGPHPGDLDRVQSISYTSGTTGRPKGAVLTERYYQCGARSAALLADAKPDDMIFLWEPFHHIAAWMSIIMGLQHGLPIALVERFSASQCWDQTRRHGATLFHYLGSAMNILLRQPPASDDGDNPIRIAWGAAAPASSWREFEQRFGVNVREGYGLSEAQNFTHLNLDGRVGSIGKPIAEFESWIEGPDGERLASRQVGEIVVRANVPNITMQGYFRAPERTREVLRSDCVYTGDLGYQDEEGYFYYVGRKKDSLRRRGENVSAWEVERVINAHPAVEEAAVVGVASELGEQDIRVFVKLASGRTLDPLDLIRWCERDLAYYQIPRYVDFVQEFPRGPTQRIRKNDLPASVADSWDLEKTGYTLQRRQNTGRASNQTNSANNSNV